MEIVQTWVTTLKNNIMGVTPPIEDVFDPTVFMFLMDGELHMVRFVSENFH